MPPGRPPGTAAELELKILRALCRREFSARDWSRLTSQLADYHWQDSDHRVVYEALTAIRSTDAETRRGQLPAQATRMGFPDVDWKIYFEAEDSPKSGIEDMIQQLKAKSPETS